MNGKNVVVRSFNQESGHQCIDIFRRPDGSFGFELYRREPEDSRGWLVIGAFSNRKFASVEEAAAEAKASVAWFDA